MDSSKEIPDSIPSVGLGNSTYRQLTPEEKRRRLTEFINQVAAAAVDNHPTLLEAIKANGRLTDELDAVRERIKNLENSRMLQNSKIHQLELKLETEKARATKIEKFFVEASSKFRTVNNSGRISYSVLEVFKEFIVPILRGISQSGKKAGVVADHIEETYAQTGSRIDGDMTVVSGKSGKEQRTHQRLEDRLNELE